MERSVVDDPVHSASAICGSCATSGCCRVDPAFLTEVDIARLKEATGREESSFVRTEVVDGATAKFLRFKGDGSSCVFFDDRLSRCTVYADRPTDCRAFPFDLDLEDGRLYWIKYEFGDCALAAGDSRSSPRDHRGGDIRGARRSGLPVRKLGIDPMADDPFHAPPACHEELVSPTSHSARERIARCFR